MPTQNTLAHSSANLTARSGIPSQVIAGTLGIAFGIGFLSGAFSQRQGLAQSTIGAAGIKKVVCEFAYPQAAPSLEIRFEILPSEPLNQPIKARLINYQADTESSIALSSAHALEAIHKKALRFDDLDYSCRSE